MDSELLLARLACERAISTDLFGAQFWVMPSVLRTRALELFGRLEEVAETSSFPESDSDAKRHTFLLLFQNENYKLFYCYELLQFVTGHTEGTFRYAKCFPCKKDAKEDAVLPYRGGLIIFPKFSWRQIKIDLEDFDCHLAKGAVPQLSEFQGVPLYPSNTQLIDNLLFASILTRLMEQEKPGLSQIFALLVSYEGSEPKLVLVTRNRRDPHDKDQDHSLLHAEYLLVSEAIKKLNLRSEHFRRYFVVYTSLQPCAQCAGILSEANIRVVYYLYRDKEQTLVNTTITLSRKQTLFINLYHRLRLLGLIPSSEYDSVTGSGKKGLGGEVPVQITAIISRFAENYFSRDNTDEVISRHTTFFDTARKLRVCGASRYSPRNAR